MKIITVDFSGYETWQIIIQFAFICLILLLSNVLRRKVPFIKRSLLPTAVIGGFIGLIIKEIFIKTNLTIDTKPILSPAFFEMITYHTIALGFIALGLTTVKNDYQNVRDGRAFKSGILIVSTYLLQGIIGMGLTIGLAYLFTEVKPFSGLLLPMGFGQGPGQANNIGRIFEEAGFLGGTTFGLSVSTLGFVWACIPGVWYLNFLQRKKLIVRNYDNNHNITSNSMIEEADEIPLAESVDKLTIQICLVGLTYLLTWIFMFFISWLLDKSNSNFLKNDIKGLVWGFNFIFAILFTMIVKNVIKWLHKRKFMNRKYTNDYMLNRIAGVAFDFMIISSIIAIDIQMLKSWPLIITLLIITTIGGIITFFYLRYATKVLFPRYEHEAMTSMFGMLTGTASTGVALLREIDPHFKTPAADNLVTGSGTAALFGAPLLIIISVAKLPGNLYLYGSFLGIIIFFFIYNFILFRAKIIKKKK